MSSVLCFIEYDWYKVKKNALRFQLSESKGDQYYKRNENFPEFKSDIHQQGLCYRITFIEYIDMFLNWLTYFVFIFINWKFCYLLFLL